jgi:drug/metabolite transporter (DMT)-like permease
LILFKEKLHPGFWLGLLCALVGIGIIFGQDLLTHPVLGLGDFYALCGGFFYGMFFLAAQRSRERLSAMLAWGISSAVSALGLLLVSLAFGMSLTDYPLVTWINILALAISTQVIGLLSVNYALGHLPASLVSPSLLGQPIVTAILAVPLLSQPLSPLQIIGGLLALAGIFVVHRSKT